MSPRESYSGRMKCQLQGSRAVIDASDAARAFGQAQRLCEDVCARFCIVVEELVANLYEHGGLTSEDQVELDLGREPDGIRITIADPGKPFDPRSATPKRGRPDRGGGAGIDIVRSWAQFVDYTVTMEGNRLELMLPI
jgi:serine/threonine-protein kinase RsbW